MSAYLADLKKPASSAHTSEPAQSPAAADGAARWAGGVQPSSMPGTMSTGGGMRGGGVGRLPSNVMANLGAAAMRGCNPMMAQGCNPMMQQMMMQQQAMMMNPMMQQQAMMQRSNPDPDPDPNLH